MHVAGFFDVISDRVGVVVGVAGEVDDIDVGLVLVHVHLVVHQFL